MQDALFVRWDTLKNLGYQTLIIVLAITCIVLYRQSHQPSPAVRDADDEQYLAAGRRVVEFLYSLNAATIVEDGHLLLKMIHPDSAALKQEHLTYLIDHDIVKKTQAAGLRSRINWSASRAQIKNRSHGARVIEYSGVYEYKTTAMDAYKSQPFALQIGLLQEQNSQETPYGIWVYGWEDKKIGEKP